MLRSLLLGFAFATVSVAADPAKDAYGDALPAGAIARLGTERLRNLDFYAGMQLMPDGKSLVAMVRSVNTMFDTTSGLPTGKVPVAQGGFSQAIHALSADGKTAATVKYDGVDVWDFATGKKFVEIKHKLYGSEFTVALSADGKRLALGGQADEKMKEKGVDAVVWDLESKKGIASVKVAQNQRAFVTISADGKTLATWGNHAEPNQAYDKYDPATDPNRLVQIWDAATGKEQTAARVNGSIASVAIAPEGNTLAASAGNGEIHLWDAKTGKERLDIIGRSRIGKSLTFSPDGKTLAASSDEGAIQLFDAATGKSKGVTPCPFASDYVQLRGVRFTAPDRAVALATTGASVVAWELPSGKRLSPAGGHTEPVFSVSFADDGKEILSSTASGAILRWDRTGKELGAFALKIPGGSSIISRPSGVAFVPGEQIVAASMGSEYCVYDMPAGIQRCALPAEGSYSGKVHFNAPRDRAVLVIPPGYSKDKPKPYRIAAFDLAAGLKKETVNLPPGDLLASALTPDGKTLIAVRRVVAEKGAPDTVLNAIEVTTGKSQADEPIKLGFGSVQITVASDGKSFLLLKGDGNKGVYETATLKSEREIKEGAHDNAAIPPLFSPDGKRVAIAFGGPYGGGTPSIGVYEWATGNILYTLVGHSQAITCMAFSKDGKTLASGSTDTTVLLWDLTKKD